MKRQLSLWSFCFLLFSGYTGFAQLTNNYRKIVPPKTLTTTDLNNAIVISFDSKKGSAPSKTKVKKSVFDLTEKGQKSLIEAYSSKEKKSNDFRKNLISPLEKTTTSSSIIDKRLLKIYRKIDFFIEDNWNKENPSNRIASLRITINLPSDSKVRFRGFKDFQTKYETITLGTLEKTSSSNFSIGAGIGSSNSDTANSYDDNNNLLRTLASGSTPSINASYGLSNSSKENITLTRRIIPQTGAISDRQMVIYLEGAPGRNLNGPISLELELEALESYQDNLDFVNFTVNSKKEPKLSPKFLIYPNISSDISPEKIECQWLYRKIVRKGKSSVEGKHVISYYNYTLDIAKKPIVEKNDLDTNIFRIRYNTSGTSNDQVYLKKGDNYHILTFLSQEEAIKFLWFIADNKKNKVDGFDLVYGKSKSLIPLNKLNELTVLKDSFSPSK